MELNFDKEIDALLRQTAKSGTAALGNGSIPVSHIDADAISAFAENALPERTRALYMTHLADCDRCRKILSNLILLNSEADVSAASSIEVPAIAAAPVPWYSKLFLFPNLAYTMGALVLVFGGMIGFLVLQNINNGKQNVSQANTYDVERPGGITSAPSAMGNSNASMQTNSPANTSANTTGRIAGFDGMSFNSNAVSDEAPTESKFLKPAEEDKLAAPPPAGGPPADDVLPERGEPVATTKELKTEVAGNAEKKTNETLAPAKPAPPPPPPTVTANRAQALPKKSAAGKDADRDKQDAAQFGAGRRQAGGKNFNRTNDVWYDTAYHGQATTDVRRGTNEYRKLDSGLRSIADSLGGTVVVVWKERAYRIQ